MKLILKILFLAEIGELGKFCYYNLYENMQLPVQGTIHSLQRKCNLLPAKGIRYEIKRNLLIQFCFEQVLDPILENA